MCYTISSLAAVTMMQTLRSEVDSSIERIETGFESTFSLPGSSYFSPSIANVFLGGDSAKPCQADSDHYLAVLYQIPLPQASSLKPGVTTRLKLCSKMAWY